MAKSDRTWTCDHCGKRETWRRGWLWYAGVDSAANHDAPWVTCSKACEVATDFGLGRASYAAC